MSETMMPISTDALNHPTLLFELSKPVIMPAEKFNEVWPYIDSVYSKLQQQLLQNNGTTRVQKYECRLRKSTKSGTVTAKVDSEGKIIKRRNSSIRNRSMSCSNQSLLAWWWYSTYSWAPWRTHLYLWYRGELPYQKPSILLGKYIHQVQRSKRGRTPPPLPSATARQ